MKNINKIISLLVAAVMVLLALSACGSGGNESSVVSGDVTYKVTVKDALGNAYTSGVVVKFMQNGTQAAMQPCDANGVAEKTLAAGDYTVELAFTDKEQEYHYGENTLLTATANEADVILAMKVNSEAKTLYVQADEYDAYSVSVGCTYVDLTSEHRSYFLFTPNTSGNYQFSVADKADAQIGYYGAPHFVQENSAAEVVDNAFTISVSDSMIGAGDSGTTTFVIGIDAGADTKNCVLGIARIGDAVKTLEDEPWTIYEATTEMTAYTLPEGAVIKEFDLTAPTDTYNLVYNEADGFYHLGSADGALVLVRLAEDSEYIASFQTILDRSGVSKYFFDENGNFVKKESYSECLLEYIEYVDEAEGVYPLTEDLKYIIQQRGDYVGWWDPESGSYLFKDENGYDLPDINHDIAWLLMCCYIG